MQTSNSKNYIILAVFLAVGFVAVFFLSNFAEATRVKMPESYADSDLSLQGSKLKGWVLGGEGLVADWYWMWSLQYLGDKLLNSENPNINVEDLREHNPRLLYPLLDNATDLDPSFMAAYSYGAIVLPAIDPALAIRFAEKGIEQNPDAWRLHQYLGYIYWRMRDYKKAAEVYEAGSRIAGAPNFLKQMSAVMLTEGGSRDTARNVYRQMLAEADDQQSRGNAELRLKELDSLDERDAITEALGRSKAGIGQCPRSITQIIPILQNIKLPNGREFMVNNNGEIVDPTGIPYEIDADNCRAKLGAGSKIPPPLN